MEHLRIGTIVFPRVDQFDFTGPFEVLSRIPDSTFHVIGKGSAPVRDVRGLVLTPDTAFAECPSLDVLIIPGGAGQQDLMEDDITLSFIRLHGRNARYIFSVCTGALLCGAAGLLQGVRATTHWSAFHLLPYFGAIPVNARVVVDDRYISAAGVSAGLDGALKLVSLVRNERLAREIQLGIEYSPEPPFNSGSLGTATKEVVEAVRRSYESIGESRLATAKRIAEKLGVKLP